jgi:hypothetical protein
VLTDKDLASLSVFNHDIQRVVPFTPDVERLRFGADDFRAYGTTRLHDSLIYVGHSFGGLKGKRALVLLSDGQDIDSDFQFSRCASRALARRLDSDPPARVLSIMPSWNGHHAQDPTPIASWRRWVGKRRSSSSTTWAGT